MTNRNEKSETENNLAKGEVGVGMTDSEKLDFLVGKVVSIDDRLQRVESKVDNLEGEVTNLKGEVANLKGEVANLKGEVANLKGEVTNLKGEVTNLKGEVTNLKGEVTNLKGEVSDLKSRVQKVERDITGLKIIVENEIRTNVSIIAENHLDLMRKFEKAKKENNEMLSIRVGKLESDMYEVKQKLA